MFTIDRLRSYLLALLGETSYEDYEVTLQDGDDVLIEYVMATSSEQAAWSAMELSTHRGCVLKNVRLCDGW